MARLIGLLLAVSGVLAACSDRPSAAIPFELRADVRETLVDWQAAGITCAEPEIGMPGPAADWYCEATAGDVPIAIRLTADRFGVQSITMGVSASTDRALAARTFTELVEATSALGAGRSQIIDWLHATKAADGSMPTASPPIIGRAHVDSTLSSSIILYLIPANSSIMSMSGNG